MLTILLTVCCALTLVVAAPQADQDASVKSYSNDVQLDGYEFAFETSNGIGREEKAKLKNAGTENEVLEVKGSYHYTAPDGKLVKVEYTADENGYQPILSIGEILAGG